MTLTQVLSLAAAAIMLLMGQPVIAVLFGAFALFAQAAGNEIDNSQSVSEVRSAYGCSVVAGLAFLALIVLVAAMLAGVVTEDTVKLLEMTP